MLTCNNLSLNANERFIFSGLSFTLFPGSITYLRGANGSGKSSLLRMIAGIQKPSGGDISLYKYQLDRIEKPYVNYIGHNTGIKDELTCLENIEIWAKLYDSESMIPAALHYFGLEEMLDIKAYTLSAGNRQKLALSRLLSCSAEIWLLDEVDAHLDEKNRTMLNGAITTKANSGGMIILTSHLESQFKQAIEIEMRGACE